MFDSRHWSVVGRMLLLLCLVAGALPALAQPADYIERHAGLDIEMVWIEGGRACLGSPVGEAGRYSDETSHTVVLDGFWMGRVEVTNTQYWRFLEASGYDGAAEADDDYLDHWRGGRPQVADEECPVVWVSWHNAAAFAEWLGQATGLDYALPTEAQWEYARRAGGAAPWPTGFAPRGLDAHARFGAAQADRVGRQQANAWGLHDMAGNVWEWCADWYDYNYYAYAPIDNPKGPAVGDRRVLRGGSWASPDADRLRAAYRHRHEPEFTWDRYGFRVICRLPAVADRPPVNAGASGEH